MSSQVGLIGLGTMGSALARNLASRGFRVSLWNRTHKKVGEFVKKYGSETFYGAVNFEDFLESLERPRHVIVMIPSGKPTEEVLEQLRETLHEGDTVMDGGNSHFKDSDAYGKKLLEKGIYFLGTGISGGEEGALKGPSLMPGGSREAWEEFEPLLNAISAEDFNGKACNAFMGTNGAGHFVKMVHNGIEYAEIQMLAEAYDFLKTLYRLEHDEIADIFSAWNEGSLNSFLLEISIEVLRRKEEGRPLLDLISDAAGQKGTGRWTSEEALALGVPLPSITGAVFARETSSLKTLRSELAALYPVRMEVPNILVSEFVEHLEKALVVTRLSNFEQGISLLKAAEEHYHFGLRIPEALRLWQGGCIIRNNLLRDMHASLLGENRSLYGALFAQKMIQKNLKSLQLVVSTGVLHSIPLFAFSGALSHFDAFRHAHLPANFIQGLRDRFGAHGYERTDKEGTFHTDWP